MLCRTPIYVQAWLLEAIARDALGKTHISHVYDKLGVNRRHQAVEQARALGLLAPAARRP